MFPEGTTPDQVTQEDAAKLIEAVRQYKADTGRSYASIARAIGYSAGALSAVLSGTYRGKWQEVILDLDTWLEDQRKHDQAPRPAAFCWTTVAKEILTIADAAIHLRTIGLVYGPDTSGIGKTMALQAIHAEKPGSILITIEAACAAPSAVFRAIADAMPDLSISSPGTSLLYRAIRDKLKGTSRLLMIDQIHSLCDTPDDKVFWMLMDLYDATGAPQLWCGTRDIAKYFDVKLAKGKQSLTQIRRRIRPRRDLMERVRGGGGDGGDEERLFTIDEIRQIFSKNKIRLASDALRFLMHLANIPDSGALGECVNLVRMATILESTKGTQLLTIDHLRAAQRFLLAADAFEIVERQMEQEAKRPIAKLA